MDKFVWNKGRKSDNLKIDVKNLRSTLAEIGQEHILAYGGHLDADEKSKLHNELSELDLCYVKEGFKKCIRSINSNDEVKLDDRMQLLPRCICITIQDITEKESTSYQELAHQQIGSGKMAILLLAGGQATRLGVSYPKGMYDVGLPSGISLFQI